MGVRIVEEKATGEKTSKDSSLERGVIGRLSSGIKKLFTKLKKNKKEKKSSTQEFVNVDSENIPEQSPINAQVLLGSETSIEEEPIAKNQQIISSKLKNCVTTEKTIARDVSGYGFTIKGTRPVRVGRVKTGGAADREGLRRGDFIIRINDTDTTESSLSVVGDTVRKASEQVRLCIARPAHKHRGSCSSVGNTKITDENAGEMHSTKVDSDDDVQERPEGQTLKAQKSTPFSHELDAAEHIRGLDLSKNVLSDLELPWQPQLYFIREERTMDIMYSRDSPKDSPQTPDTVWRPALALCPGLGKVHSFEDSYTTLESTAVENIYEEIKVPDNSLVDSYTSVQYFKSGTSTCRNDTDAAYEELSWQHSSRISEMQGDITRSRQVAVQQLVTCEEDFCRLMKRGIQRFSRPLRHHILSQSQHRLLFQNMEKLVALSEHHISLLTQSSFCSEEESFVQLSEDDILEDVGAVYLLKVEIMCEAYRLYSEGLENSLLLLQALNQYPKFYKYMQKIESDDGFGLRLEKCLQQPVSHLQQLVGSLGRVLVTTPRDHPDHLRLSRLVAALHKHTGV